MSPSLPYESIYRPANVSFQPSKPQPQLESGLGEHCSEPPPFQERLRLTHPREYRFQRGVAPHPGGEFTQIISLCPPRHETPQGHRWDPDEGVGDHPSTQLQHSPTRPQGSVGLLQPTHLIPPLGGLFELFAQQGEGLSPLLGGELGVFSELGEFVVGEWHY